MQMQQRDLREFIPGRHKTVYLDQPLLVGGLGSLFPLPIGVGLLWCTQQAYLSSLAKHDVTGMVMAVGILGLLGGFWTFVGMLMLYTALDGWSSMTFEALCDHFDASLEALSEVVRAEHIRSAIQHYGVDVYHPGAFRSLRQRATLGAPYPLAVRVHDVCRDNRAAFILAGAVVMTFFGMTKILRAGQPATNSPRVFISPRTHKRIILPPENPESPEPVMGNPHWQPEPHSVF